MIDGKEMVSQQDERRSQVISALGTNAPRLAAFLNLYQSAFIDGTLSSKVKHLIALATVVAQRSDQNISHHVGGSTAVRSQPGRNQGSRHGGCADCGNPITPRRNGSAGLCR